MIRHIGWMEVNVSLCVYVLSFHAVHQLFYSDGTPLFLTTRSSLYSEVIPNSNYFPPSPLFHLLYDFQKT